MRQIKDAPDEQKGPATKLKDAVGSASMVIKQEVTTDNTKTFFGKVIDLEVRQRMTLRPAACSLVDAAGCQHVRAAVCLRPWCCMKRGAWCSGRAVPLSALVQGVASWRRRLLLLLLLLHPDAFLKR